MTILMLAPAACGGAAGVTASGVSTTLPAVTSTVPQVTSLTAAEVDSVIGTWGLDSIIVDAEPMALSAELAKFEEHPGVAAWIRFEEGDFAEGHLPCNYFKGDYEQRGSVIEWELVKDAAACLEPDGVMEAEAPMTDLIFTLTVDVEVDEAEGRLELSALANRWSCRSTGLSCPETTTGGELPRSDVVMTFSRLDD